MNTIIADSVVSEFTRYLENKFPEILEAIVLYGSRARGDFQEHSDYDFLVLYHDSVNKKNIQDAVLDAEVLVMDKFEKLASSLIWSDLEWKRKQKFPLGINILKEGKYVWTKKSP